MAAGKRRMPGTALKRKGRSGAILEFAFLRGLVSTDVLSILEPSHPQERYGPRVSSGENKPVTLAFATDGSSSLVHQVGRP